ncbi:hypothetical protein [Cohaesibacter marisflavi]|uniref:hypothetical protein n=1 Tax=Cohaesibacter marisflavi TaxID=655353 RepID=UPI0029C8F8D8|nr:hypothetical protein [Cohaesibacter marisflavi]
MVHSNSTIIKKAGGLVSPIGWQAPCQTKATILQQRPAALIAQGKFEQNFANLLEDATGQEWFDELAISGKPFGHSCSLAEKTSVMHYFIEL